MQVMLRRAWVPWLLLALPLLAIGAWLATLGAGYGAALLLEGWVAALGFTGLLVSFARWRVLGPVSWLLAWVVYLAAFAIALAEAMAWYFQGSGFSIRFFANLRLGNLQAGLQAFPALATSVAGILLVVLLGSAWLLLRLARRSEHRPGHAGRKAALLLALGAVTVIAPSAWQRLGAFVIHYRQNSALASAALAGSQTLLADPNPVPRSAVRARPGKNLVIIYMESLERIYTDNKIFPGLTPNLNQWRARGLDYAGYLTYPGADYTIAGLFASQCGVPYLPSPIKALDGSGNNTNVTGFQPNLACLGDVLHAAGYDQAFMNGVDLSFAGDGTFFRLHGFNQVLGLKQLDDLNGKPLPHPGWGLYDSDLFRLAAKKYAQLAAADKPFNLDVLTIDNHPPHGRPSPGCPKYAANDNDVLQAVHCTDYLVGKFLDTISKSPAFKNTVVVVMSDHQSMRSDAYPLYPKWYKRRPLLFILNAGQGRRAMRFYHMDIAPTVLHLMGVKTNATFLAGADRSAANAPNSPLENTPVDVAILRRALWARAQPLTLCKRGVLVGAADAGVRIGGYPIPMVWHGRPVNGLWSDRAWLVQIGSNSVHGMVLNTKDGTPMALPKLVTLAHEYMGEGSALLVRPLLGAGVLRRFSIDWVGSHGGLTHLADVPRLRDLEIASPDCASLLTQMNALPTGETLDLSKRFKATTAPLYPKLPKFVSFTKPDVLPYLREVGWSSTSPWGDFASGAYATMGFTLPRKFCHAREFKFTVHPYLPASRPNLGVKVYANGALLTTWSFGPQDTKPTWHDVSVLVRTPDPECRVDLKFVFSRPGAAPPPYPKGEDRRPLQLAFLSVQHMPPVDAAHK